MLPFRKIYLIEETWKSEDKSNNDNNYLNDYFKIIGSEEPYVPFH